MENEFDNKENGAKEEDSSMKNEYSSSYGSEPDSTYSAPEYHDTNDHHLYGGTSYGNQNTEFHNEYQEIQDPGSQYGNQYQQGMPPKKKGSAKKVIAIAAGALAVVIAAGAAVKGLDVLISSSQDNRSLISEREGSKQKENENSGQYSSDSDQDSNESESGFTGSTSQSTKVTAAATDPDRDRYTVSDIAEESMAAMVSIDCTTTDTYNYFGNEYSQDATGSGSGFILGENDQELFIATNNHVVEGANKIEITFIDEKKAQATTKGTDATADLAVVSVQKSALKKDTLNNIKIASLGKSDDVRLGEKVIAIGNALGYGQSVTVGYVSAKDRSVKVSDKESMVLLQTDAAINPGNSGGALLNLDGEVIGIPSIKYADSTVEGMGFAIPISRAFPILDELMNREILKDNEKGYLGVSCLDVTSEANDYYGMPIGVYVSEVADKGAAKEGGVQVGDIITAINGMETTSKEALVEKVQSYRIGTEVTLTIQRSNNGKYKEIELKVKLKNADSMDGLSTAEDQAGSNSKDNNSKNTNPGNRLPDNPDSTPKGDNEGNSDFGDFYDFFSDYFK